LFNEAEATSEPEKTEPESPTTNEPKAKAGRNPFTKNLPQTQVFAYLSDTEKEGAINTFFVKVQAWLTANKPRVDTDSLTGKAMAYLHNQWDKLIVYCTDGQLRISNIMAENAIRPFAVGRRAWLFADTPAGANASAAHYSLIETARLHGIEPYAYLNTIFKAIP
jgi:hypothetical protein